MYLFKWQLKITFAVKFRNVPNLNLNQCANHSIFRTITWYFQKSRGFPITQYASRVLGNIVGASWRPLPVIVETSATLIWLNRGKFTQLSDGRCGQLHVYYRNSANGVGRQIYTGIKSSSLLYRFKDFYSHKTYIHTWEARWSSGQCTRRAIAEAKHRSRLPVLGWVTNIYYLELLRASEGTLSRWSRLHLQSLVPSFKEGWRQVGGRSYK
jgi:hypothetical protein